jgi:hypothetical protein
MRSRGFKALVFVALVAGYSVAFHYGANKIGEISMPHWWPGQAPVTIAKAYSWFISGRVLVALTIGTMIGMVCARCFPRRPIVAAFCIGVLAFMLSQYVWLSRVGHADVWIKARLCIDLLVLAIVPTIAVMVPKRVISNNSLELQ